MARLLKSELVGGGPKRTPERPRGFRERGTSIPIETWGKDKEEWEHQESPSKKQKS